MEDWIRSTDDIAGLQAHVGGSAPLSYVDLRRQEALLRALERWPMLAAIHRLRAAKPAEADPAGTRGSA